MTARLVIPFFTDQNVPDSLGEVLRSAGHKLTRLRDVMDTASADPIIGVACAESGQVLVTHDKDFRTLAKRLQITKRQSQVVASNSDALPRTQVGATYPRSPAPH